MKNFAAFAFLMCFGTICYAQTDSSIVYKNELGQTTTADSAFIYTIVTKDGNNWNGKTYYSKTKALFCEAKYFDKNCDHTNGDVKFYDQAGLVEYTVAVENEKPKHITYYYKDGKKKSFMTYVENGQGEQKGWDKNGDEIPGYIVLREPRFKGGPEAWTKYLQKHLNADVAVESGAPVGRYETRVEFWVSKDGLISKVKAVNIPGGCKPCAVEAVNVISSGPEWEPAILNNVPIARHQAQLVTFEVTEAKKKKRLF